MAQAPPEVNYELPLADIFAQFFRQANGEVQAEFTIMVIGRTGSGKSTFSNFLLQTNEEKDLGDDHGPDVVEPPDHYPPKNSNGIEPAVLDLGPFELLRRSFVAQAGGVGVTRFCRHITKIVQVPGDERRRVQFRVVDTPGIPDAMKANSKVYVDRICQYLRTQRVDLIVHVLYHGREGANGVDLQRQWDRDAVLINHVLTSLVDIPVVSMVSYRHSIIDDINPRTQMVRPAKLDQVVQVAESNMDHTIQLLCNPGGARVEARINPGCAALFFHTHPDLSRICIRGLVLPMMQALRRRPELQHELLTASELLEGYHASERMYRLAIYKLGIAEKQLAGWVLWKFMGGSQRLFNENLAFVREQREIDPHAKLAEVRRLIEMWNSAT